MDGSLLYESGVLWIDQLLLFELASIDRWIESSEVLWIRCGLRLSCTLEAMS